MKPSELMRRRHQHVLVFGDSKSGKSTLVAELLLKGYNLTWVSLDNGHEVIFKLPLTAEQFDERLNIIPIPDTREFPVALATCKALFTGAECKICFRHGQHNCSTCVRDTNAAWSTVCGNRFSGKDILVVDHLGQLANSTMNYILRKKDDEYKPEWEHYRIQGTLMDGMLTNVQQARFNIICITHAAEAKMEDGRKKLVPVIGTDNFSRNAGKYFDHIIYSDVFNNKHTFGSSSTFKAGVITGSRSDVEIESAEQPSLDAFFNGKFLPREEYAEDVGLAVLQENKETPPVKAFDTNYSPPSPADTKPGPVVGNSNPAELLARLKAVRKDT